MSTVVPVHQYTCSVYFFFLSITCTVTFQLIYWGMYGDIPGNKFSCLFSCFSMTKTLLVTTATSIPAHRCTHSLPYLFILIISFRQTISTYLSSYLLFLVFTDLPSTNQFHLCVFFMWLYMHSFCSSLSTHLLVCIPTEPPKILMLLAITMKTCWFNCLHVHRCTCSKNLCSFLCIHFESPPRSTCPPNYCSTYIQIYPEINLPLYHDALLPANHEDLPVD